MSWSFDTEGSAVSDDSPTVLGQPSMPVYKTRGWIPWSIEIGQDYPGFADEMAQLLAAGYDERLAQKLTVGSGDADGHIFAAGDATHLPVKQGGVGAQQADTAAAGNRPPGRGGTQAVASG